MGRVQGKVAFITGAARGQGRSHAVRLAEEGADIIAVDLCHDIESLKYHLAGSDDLKETVRLVEAQDRRIVAVQADVRERAQLAAALEQGIGELGRLDIVVAQAGIAAMKGEPPMQAWTDVIDTNLLGTINAIHAALPHLSEGASIIPTGSIAHIGGVVGAHQDVAALVRHVAVGRIGFEPGRIGKLEALERDV